MVAKKRGANSFSPAVLDIGRQIRLLRQAKGWTQVQLAKESQIDQPFVAIIESGNWHSLNPRFYRLCYALDSKVAEVIRAAGH